MTDYVFDSFGRMTDMTYPDGEALHYAYDNGGLLKAAWGEKDGSRYNYINSLLYDEFGQRTHIAYGNGTISNYTYDDKTRRLDTLVTTLNASQGNRQVQNLSYHYDLVGNVMDLQNGIAVATSTALPAGPVTQSFGYDDLYQITAAKGAYGFGPGKQNNYTNAFKYDTIGNMTQKEQVNQVIQPSATTTLPKETNYVLSYVYGSSKPHAVTDAGDKLYAYDANGNMTGWNSKTSGQKRTIIWNEENRVKEIDDNGKATYFLYDDAGERVVKRGQYGETIYINRFYAVKNGELGTKHIFAGETRVLSKLVKTPSSTTDNTTAIPGSNGLTQGRGKKLGIIKRLPDGTTTTIVQPIEKDEFYYHGDHLGSSNMITDSYGAIYQHLEYFPYGESWIEEGGSHGGNLTGYKFTGKELDPETGLYYYGARYYDAVLSRWISADPMMIQYLDGKPNDGVYKSLKLSLYAYTSWNPVIYVDPNGLWEMYKSTGEFIMKCDKCSDQSVQIVEFENDGSMTFYATKNITAAEFHEVAATIYGESSEQAPASETLGMAHVVNTRSKEEQKSLYDVAVEPKQFFGRTNDAANNYRDKLKYNNGPGEKAKRVREGIFGMMLGEKDPTGGAQNFEGVKLYGTKKSKFKQRFVDTGKMEKTVQLGGTFFFKKVTPPPKPEKKTKTDE